MNNPQFVTLDGVRTRYFEAGKGDDLVLIHGGKYGTFYSAYHWSLNFHELSRHFHVFGVQNPEDGEIGYCCVLGELGEVLGLVVYLGTEGLEQHRNIHSGKLHAGSPEFIYRQYCLTAWLADRNELDKTDLKVVKQLGLEFHASSKPNRSVS